MAEYNKQRFYWIKLTDRFMTSDTVDFLMEQKDGANYVVIYQMLCLKTVNNDGCLSRSIGEMIIPYDEEKIQRDLKWFSIDTIRVAMNLYKRLGLIYEQDDGVLRITDFDNLVGSQSISAEKKQIQRAKTGQNQIENKGGQEGGQMSTRERYKDKEKDKDNIDINNVPQCDVQLNCDVTPYYIEIINYLNEAIGMKYRYQSKLTQRLINARFKEGYTVDDFKTVIDKKAKEWKGTEMEQFLRPETLFSTKFEGYLNAPIKNCPIGGAGNKTPHFANERKYSTSECNNLLRNIDDIDF